MSATDDPPHGTNQQTLESQAERTRLMKVAMALADASAQPRSAGALGKRKLPVVQDADATGLMHMMHEQLEYATKQRSADAKAAGFHIACDRGCNACCTLPVLVGEPEAAAVERWLLLPENAGVRARFTATYPTWREALGSAIEEVAMATNLEQLGQASKKYGTRRVLCPFNHNGDCTVYPVRPALCRTTHALETKDACESDGNSVKTLAHPGVDTMYQGQSGIRDLMHDAMRPGHRHEVLAKAVQRRLVRHSAAPNQPCPCGSALKFKHCCRL
jgi:Fe-S-cluster containining protein